MYQRVLDRCDRGGRDRRAKGREFQSGRGGSFWVLVVGYVGVVVTVGWLVVMIGGLEGNVVVGMMRKVVVSLGMVGMAVVVV